MKTLLVDVRHDYGRITVVPLCENALRFATLLRQKTLTEENIRHIKDLGYEIKVKEKVL